MKNDSLKDKNKKRLLLITSGLCGLLILGLGIYYFVGRPIQSTSQSFEDNITQTTSEEETAQENFTDGSVRDPGNTLRENRGSATIEDSEGSASIDPALREDAQSSSTGEITVFNPKNGAAIKSGQIIAGESSLKTVNYRLIDDLSGVVTSGSLVVKGGKFSGVIEFSTGAKNGRLDLFGIREDLSEFSVIELELSLK